MILFVLFCLTVELLFLIFGIYLCYSVRGAPCEFHENRYISVAIYNETIFSLFLYVSRYVIGQIVSRGHVSLFLYVSRYVIIGQLVSRGCTFSVTWSRLTVPLHVYHGMLLANSCHVDIKNAFWVYPCVRHRRFSMLMYNY